MDLINKIVNDIFTDGQNRKAKRLVLEFEGQKFNETGRNKLSVHSIIKKHLESNSGVGASYAPLTVLEIASIKEKAMKKKYKLFKEEKWKMNHILTDGDVRLIIETYLENKGA